MTLDVILSFSLGVIFGCVWCVVSYNVAYYREKRRLG